MTALISVSSSPPQQQQEQQQQLRRSVPTVELNQIQTECLLGSGSFASVFAISVESEEFDMSYARGGNSLEFSSDDFQASCSSFSCSSSSSSSSAFALKAIRMEVLCSDREQRQHASHDMSKEARLLASLPEHPHIVRLCGISKDFWASGFDLSATALSSRYMILEKLETTLFDKLKLWRRMPKMRPSLEQDRLVQAGGIGLGQALQVLHENGMIYRDIKPQNIGYGWDGQVKLFDFGLARKVETQPGKLMTSCVGTLRYMAPEVATMDCYYNESADIYSWAMLMWEVVTLEKPFSEATSMEELHEWVVDGDEPPHTKSIQSPRLRQLLTACTDREAEGRPDWNSILQRLQVICHKPSAPQVQVPIQYPAGLMGH